MITFNGQKRNKIISPANAYIYNIENKLFNIVPVMMPDNLGSRDNEDKNESTIMITPPPPPPRKTPLYGLLSSHQLPNYKLVILGDSSVGKTSIMTQFAYQHFNMEYNATIGIDFSIKQVTTENRSVKLQIWDTAGQERFFSLIPSYIREADVALIVYAIDNPQSFERVERWLDIIHQYIQTPIMLVLVANKIDLRSNLVYSEIEHSDVDDVKGESQGTPNTTKKTIVSHLDGVSKAQRLGIPYREICAKRKESVVPFFYNLVDMLPDKLPPQRLIHPSLYGGAQSSATWMDYDEHGDLKQKRTLTSKGGTCGC